MAVTPHVTGPALVKIDYGGGLANFGYTADGVFITGQPFTLDVPGDQNGGESGPPIDVQHFGSIMRVRVEMTSWEGAVASALSALTAGGTAGVQPTMGTLLGLNSLTYRVLILPTTDPINFPKCIIKAPWEINKGSKYGRLIFEFEAHSFTGTTVFNSTTS